VPTPSFTEKQSPLACPVHDMDLTIDNFGIRCGVAKPSKNNMRLQWGNRYSPYILFSQIDKGFKNKRLIQFCSTLRSVQTNHAS